MELTVTSAPAEIPPEGEALIVVQWTPDREGTLDATATVRSNDPVRALASVPLTGQALPSAVAEIARDPIVAALPPDSPIEKTRTLSLGNSGAAALNWSAAPHAFIEVEPAAGVVMPGAFAQVTMVLRAAGLAAGDHVAPLVLLTDDPTAQRIEIPVTLHVGEIEPEEFQIDFSPRYATVADTVEISLQLPAGLDPADVVIESVVLFDSGGSGGLAPLPGQVSFHDLNLDGVMELILQFDLEAFEESQPRDAESQTPIPIIGEVEDRTWFRGSTWPRGVFPVDQ